ncbi:Hemolysin activation/secretion protein [Methylobacillus rhizosphaerae]|uniref:Hemolysin activation/secretion protein n=2 Tax=Methylobacillus rhizosphaerae TaxID=551994 RepID=A0A239B4F6_9PROT|nr:Hemolysin activation/secretion protein [Methylobacillus rhizosphaerae]
MQEHRKHLEKVGIGVLISSILFTPTALYAENPVDTLPKAETPKTRSQAEINVQQQSTISPELQKVLNTEIQPASFGIYGVKAVPFEEVSAFFAPYANKKVTIGKLVELSQQVTAFYQQRGLPLSFSYIPAQNFNERVIKVVVIEGHIGSVKIEGNPGATESKIREIVEPLLNEKPLTRPTMERYTTMLGLLPGLKIQAFLPLPQQMDGASELTLKVERKSIEAMGRLENVRPFTRGIVTVRASGNTSLAEEITASTLISSQNEQYYALSYAQPIGKEGLLIRVDASDYDGKPTTDLGDDLRRHVKTQRLSVGLTYPLLLRQDRSLLGSVALTANNFDDNIRSKQTGAAIKTTADVRTLSVGGTYSDTTATRGRRLQLMMSRGLDALGASKSVDYLYGGVRYPFGSNIDLSFSKYVVSFVQRNYLGNNWGTAISGMAQYSGDSLPISEKIQFGGYQYGRAYRPGRLAGDSGWGISLELNRTIPFSYKLPFYNLAGLQPYVMMETARIYEHIDQSEYDHISSVSLGMRLISDQPDRTNLDFSLSKAVGSGSGSNAFKDMALGFNFGIPF